MSLQNDLDSARFLAFFSFNCKYTGRQKWILKINYEWSNGHDIKIDAILLQLHTDVHVVHVSFPLATPLLQVSRTPRAARKAVETPRWHRSSSMATVRSCNILEK